MPKPTINPWRSERLIYRAVEVDDEAFLLSLNSDAESFMNSAPFVPLPQGKSDGVGFREWITKQLLAAVVCLPAPVANPAAVPGSDDASTKPIPIGVVNLNAIEAPMAHQRRTEIGICMSRPYHGQGYGTEAIKWALRFGFRHCNIHRIEIGGFSYNPRALKLYEKLGFKVEARKRDFWWHDGKYHDAVGLAMLEDEWRELYDKE